MLAGTASNTDPKKVNSGMICHRCWKSTNDNTFTGGAPCSGADTVEVPMDISCKMVRQTIIFPGCWDGKNLDSPDHKTHVSYGAGSGATGGGACPSTHPVKLPQIMYELMWNTSSFMDKSIFPTDGSNPFIYSMNRGGAAAHGDYVFGWKDNSLQLAMDKNCNLNKDCPAAGLHAQTPEVYNACTKKQQAPESVDGCKFSLSSPSTVSPRSVLTAVIQGSRLCRWATWRSRHRRVARSFASSIPSPMEELLRGCREAGRELALTGRNYASAAANSFLTFL